MKKTFTVNIGHSIFNIDEDAYEILNRYLDSIKSYFITIESEGEIIKDFELRIAENFSFNTSDNKKSIDLKDVKSMIEIMGTLDDFKEVYGNDQSDENHTNEDFDNKLYRDSSNRILGGVCSGIAQYFKIDPIIVRILFFLFSGFGLIAYLILWIGVPIKDFDPNLRKTLYRDKENSVLGGVAKGLSNYFKMEVTLIRLIFFISVFFGGFGLLVYLFLWVFTKEAKTIGQKMNMSGFNVNLSNIEDFIKKKTGQINKKENIITRIFLFPFRLVAPLINLLSRFASVFFKVLFFLATIFIAALASVGLLFTLVSIFSKADNLIFDLIKAVPSYLIITISINQVLTIFLAILVSARILFNRKIKSHLIMIVFFLWLVCMIFNILSVPGLIIQIQELNLLSDDGSYSFIWKWDDGMLIR
mgnify:FL=1